MATNQQLDDRPPLTPAVEDYVKAIYTLEGSGEAASTNALAARLDITPAAVSGMLRKLAGLGLVEHEPYGGVG
jgi:DtxR family Mn-dependent transcriptional regulator